MKFDEIKALFAVIVKKTAFWNVETCCMVGVYHTARRHIAETRCLGETVYPIYFTCMYPYIDL